MFNLKKIVKIIKTKMNSITFNITMLNVLLTVIPLIIVGIYFYFNMYLTTKNNYEYYFNNHIEAIGDKIYDSFKISNNSSLSFIADNNLRKIFIDDIDFSSPNHHTEINQVFNNLLIFDYSWQNGLLDMVYVIDTKGNAQYVSRKVVNPEQSNHYVDLILNSNNISDPNRIIPTNTEHLILSKKVYDINTLKPLGYVALVLNSKIIFEPENFALNSQPKDTNAFGGIENYDLFIENENIIVSDLDGIVLYHTDNNKIGKKIDSIFNGSLSTRKTHELIINNTKFLVKRMHLKKYKINIFIVIPKSVVFLDMERITFQYFIIILLLVFIAVLFSYTRSRAITKPFTNVMSGIEKIKKGDYFVEFTNSKYTEFQELTGALTQMQGEINQLINEVYEGEILLKDSELKLLRSQIDPHFLFNTLEAISWHAKGFGNNTVYNAIISLSEIMRASITVSSTEKNSLENELKYIDFYLNLQQLRLEDRLTIRKTIADKKLLKYHVPKFCIQAIVENTIVHGFEQKRGNCILTIQIWEEEHDLCIIVEDNGVGFSLAEQKKNKKNHTGIGFNNSDNRIKSLYGNEYGMEIKSVKDKGTKVFITMPLDKGDTTNV